jgi:hypothetical protein
VTTNTREVLLDNFSWTAFQNGLTAGFNRHPDGAFTDSNLQTTGIGVRSPNTNGANDEHTAYMAEWFGVGLDPAPAATGDRRRLLAG